MANKGLVMDIPYGGKTYYLLVPGLIGFMEFTFMRRNLILTASVPIAAVQPGPSSIVMLPYGSSEPETAWIRVEWEYGHFAVGTLTAAQAQIPNVDV